jgi:D-beta-D-heptose 7-phosphate kinase/D-beta-D-heptose 1-phosphate adenosyltransferase
VNTTADRLRTRSEARQIAVDLHAEGRRLIFTNGCFDLLHVEHVNLLRQARALGDCLIVGLNTDRSVRRLKGPGRPINAERDRAGVLSAIRYVDHVVLFHEDTPCNLIRVLKPDVLVKGGDYRPEGVVGGDIVRAYGGEVSILETDRGVSTTGTIERILDRHWQPAAHPEPGASSGQTS